MAVNRILLHSGRLAELMLDQPLLLETADCFTDCNTAHIVLCAQLGLHRQHISRFVHSAFDFFFQLAFHKVIQRFIFRHLSFLPYFLIPARCVRIRTAQTARAMTIAYIIFRKIVIIKLSHTPKKINLFFYIRQTITIFTCFHTFKNKI